MTAVGPPPPSPEAQDPLEGFLVEARERAGGGDPTTVAIRKLLAFVGAARRGSWVVSKLERAIEAHGLFADPPLTQGWIDNTVVLRRLKPVEESPTAATVDAATIDSGAHVALTVASLRSATAGVCSVERAQDIGVARARMLRFDYAQLAVQSGPRNLVGAVSWESMAKAALRGPSVTLADATVHATTVRPSDDLIALIPRIAAESFVFVVGDDRTLLGIVTTADLSDQFATLANPFFLIGEIERRLRLILERHFDADELGEVLSPDDPSREVASADNLTLGEIVRLLEKPERWSQLGWASFERKEFISSLDEVREIRNDVMHFSPDPLASEQLTALQNFIAWLRVMEPRI